MDHFFNLDLALTQFSMDHFFDLDLALTMEMEEDSDHSTKDLVSLSSPTHQKSCMSQEMAITTVAAPIGVNCVVCMQGFKSATIAKQIPCGHVYHANCIATWLSLHDSCPLCRCKISGNRKISPAGRST
ncbi:E3 ubiquitin-protein like [Actinidia chinensis var. chinensis]|uniref:RING-type E3 ubiquitin transferase n=1 Tax=Actinidia chinensis var. chinensis TaxID=1590841 RepID=A0A2R6R4D6_ACTCC|nr:E3 ubiquitin-protein like [Actinidia chinensis var. chinensis]